MHSLWLMAVVSRASGRRAAQDRTADSKELPTTATGEPLNERQVGATSAQGIEKVIERWHEGGAPDTVPLLSPHWGVAANDAQGEA